MDLHLKKTNHGTGERKKQPGNSSTHVAVKAPRYIKGQRNEGQTVAEEEKILPLLHQSAPPNNWGDCVVIVHPQRLSVLCIYLDHTGTFLCVWWEVLPNAAATAGHKQRMSHIDL